MIDSAKLAAILLGSETYPLMPPKFSHASFGLSARAFKDYLLDNDYGLGICHKMVLDMFNSEDPIERQDFIITSFLRQNKKNIDSIIIFYVGHGGFLADRQYVLSVKSTDYDRQHFTSLRGRDLAETLKSNASGCKIYLILDCCFAGSIVDTFQSVSLSRIIEDQTYDEFPAFGTALLAASSRNEPAIAPEGANYTMMTESLLSVLLKGARVPKDFLSLREVGEETALLIRQKYGFSSVRPEVHSPKMINGDPADIPIFPNRCTSLLKLHAKKEVRLQLYDSRRDTAFSEWFAYNPATYPGQAKKAGPVTSEGSVSYSLRAENKEHIGVNKTIEAKRGLVNFSYKIIQSNEKNIVFYIIPMRRGEKISPGKLGKARELKNPLYEGENGFSNFRRLYIPENCSNSDWIDAEIAFDFSDLEEFAFAFFAPRINEGVLNTGPGNLLFRDVKIFALIVDERNEHMS